MKVKVRWLGFHDSIMHESDILESYSEVQKFINEALIDPEPMTAYLVDAITSEKVSFADLKNSEVIESATSVTPIYAVNMNDYKEFKKEKYFNKGELFGLPDSYIIEPYEEYLERDIGNFVIFYKYGEYIYSEYTSPSIHNSYYLAYDKVNKGVYTVYSTNNGAFDFSPLLDKNTGNIIDYDQYMKSIRK